MSLNFVIPEINIGGNGTEIPTLQFWKKGFRIGGGKVEPTWRDIILSGNTALTLVNSKANGLNYLKLFGNTELLSETYLDTVTLSGGCEQRNLPVGHQQLAYLQGDGTAYIQTPVEPTDTTGMKIVFEYGSAGGSGAICGTFDSVSPRQDTFFVSTNSGTVDTTWAFIAQAGSTLSSINSEAPVAGKTYTALINYKNSRTFGFEGFTQQSVGSNGVLSNKVLLFARLNIANNNITASNCKIKYVEFTEGTAVTHIYIPARFNNTLGLYDKITGAFLPNTNTSGSFTAGANVTTPTPSNPIDIISNNGAIRVSKNVFDYKYYYDHYQTYQTSSVGRCPIKLKPNTTYTISTNTETNTTSASVFVVVGNSMSWTPNTSNNGVLVDSPRTVTTDSNGYLCLGIYCKGASEIPESDFDNGTVWVQIEQGSTATEYRPYGQIYTDGTVEQVTDSLGNTANAERLLAVGTYKDTQSVINGSVTKRVGIKVLDGTESWVKGGTYSQFYSVDAITDRNYSLGSLGYCTHYTMGSGASDLGNYGYMRFGIETQQINFSSVGLSATTVEQWQQWLAEQYANGTPVIVVYIKNSATTSTVTGQFLSKSPVTQTAGSISNLPIAITESAHTVPTPQQPLQINCNNGVVKVSKNLFDKNQEFVNGYINDSGQLVSHESLQTTANYIPVLPNTTYTISFTALQTSLNNFNVSTWTSNNAFYGRPVRSSITSTGQNQYTFTTQSAVTKIKVSLWANSNVYTNFQIEQGSTATPYTPYSPTGIYVDGTTETVEITGKNLFNVATAINGYYIDVNGNLMENENFSYSALIPVVEGSTYMWSGTSTRTTLTGKRIHGYNSNGEWVQQINSIAAGSGNYSLSATIPSEVAYIRISGMRINDSPDTNIQIELGSTATTYEQYYSGGTATAQPLYKVGTYQDVQSVIDGGVTRNVGVKVLDGSESWTSELVSGVIRFYIFISDMVRPTQVRTTTLICSQFQCIDDGRAVANVPMNSIYCGSGSPYIYIKSDKASDTTGWKQYLSDQYNAGQPVVILYPLQTPTTETVTPQPMNIQEGTNIVQITQASMDDLELEVKYKAGVAVTITEIENAQLDDNVEVTING